MEQIILENKKLFFDTGNTAILLITDLSHGINLKCNLDEYVSGFIFHQTTSFDEWLIISRNLGLGSYETLERALSRYSDSRGNYRKMVNKNIMTLDTDFLLYEEILLFLIEKHYFVRNSEKEYRDLLIEFFLSFVKLLQKVDEITIESSKEYLDGFLEKHRIIDIKSNLIFKKFLQVLEKPFIFHDVTFDTTDTKLQLFVGYDLGKKLTGLINELHNERYKNVVEVNPLEYSRTSISETFDFSGKNYFTCGEVDSKKNNLQISVLDLEDNDTTHISYIKAPVIFIGSLGQSSCKFEIQLALYRKFLERKVNSKNITFNPAGILYDFYTYKYPKSIKIPEYIYAVMQICIRYRK